MRQLIDACAWLTVFQLPAYAPEFRLVEVRGSRSRLTLEYEGCNKIAIKML